MNARSGEAKRALFLRSSRIVGRIHIVDLPRTDAMELNDCFSFEPGSVFHASWPVTK